MAFRVPLAVSVCPEGPFLKLDLRAPCSFGSNYTEWTAIGRVHIHPRYHWERIVSCVLFFPYREEFSVKVIVFIVWQKCDTKKKAQKLTGNSYMLQLSPAWVGLPPWRT